MYEAVQDYSGLQVVGFCVNCNEIWDFTKWTPFFSAADCPAIAVKHMTIFV
jgi:hypothetical protein